MEHMEEEVNLIKIEDPLGEMEVTGIELSEAEVQEAAEAVGVDNVNCLVTSTDPIHEIQLQSGLPQQILATETEEEEAEMIIDESKVSRATFVSISAMTDEDPSLSDLGKDMVLVEVEQELPSSIDCDQGLEESKLDSAKSTPKETTDNGVPVVQLPFAFPGQSFNEQAQKLILNVWDFFKRAKKDPHLVHNLRGPQDHAAAALNVGTKTIGKIAKRVIRLGKLETPGKKRNRPKTVLDSVGAEGEEVLRSIIREMYDRRVAPTIPLVLAEAKTRINFKGSTTSLRRILKRMGYKYGGIDNSLIQSDKVNVSGWKEKSSKKSKPWRPNQARKKTMKKSIKQAEEPPPVIEPVVPQIVEADGIIQSHEICQQDLHTIQPHEVIIHYQKPNEAYISQAGQNQIITVTTDPAEIIQLQLDSNGETVPVTVVQEWQWQSLQKLDDVL
ncbi:unnamed protein product, partial [Allacma fusca]